MGLPRRSKGCWLAAPLPCHGPRAGLGPDVCWPLAARAASRADRNMLQDLRVPRYRVSNNARPRLLMVPLLRWRALRQGTLSAKAPSPRHAVQPGGVLQMWVGIGPSASDHPPTLG